MASGDTMTNAIVAAVVSASAARRLILAYKGGTVTVGVPRATAVHRLMLVPRASLKPGMRVLVRGAGNADAGMTASVILVQ
jgi:hypothetical protein